MFSKRQIIRDMSVCKKSWTFADELQFQWIMFRIRQEGILKVKNLRSNVKRLLLKHEKKVERIGSGIWEVF